MAFARPSMPDLISRTTQDLITRMELTSTVLRVAFVRIMARVWSGAVNGLYGYLDWESRQFLTSTADDDDLDLHGADMGVPRDAATFASGPVSFTGTGTPTVPAGSVLQRSDGLQFATLVDAPISAGVGTATVQCTTSGSAGNTDAAVTLTLISPIAGVQSAATVGSAGITNGTDTEADDPYRARILARKQQPPQGGSMNDYVAWAEAADPAVTRAWCFPGMFGAGTVGVMFCCDNQEDTIVPDVDLVATVQAYITDPSRRPVCATVTVFAPTLVPQNFSLSVYPNTSAVQAAVEAELADLLVREGGPAPGATTATIHHSEIDEAISLAEGEQYHDLETPAGDIVLAIGQLPSMGVVTWL